MARFLLLPFAPTTGLAHVGACLSVGRVLREAGHETVFGYGGSSPELITGEGFRCERVAELPREREWTPAQWFRSPAEARALVESHLELIERTEPDAAITSAGIASRLACEVARLPNVHLMHYLPLVAEGRGPSVVWGARLRDVRRPRRVVRRLRKRLRRSPAATNPAFEAVVAARAELGLRPIGPGAAGECHDALLALTTTPTLDPARDLPAHWRYVGPLTWSAPGAGPAARRGRPLVYVTQGSTGSPEALRRAVADLAGEPIDVLASTGGLVDPAELERLGPNVRADALLSGRDCLRAADVAVVHGGHLTSVEGLLAGTPMVVLPYRGDHFASAARAERLGVGVGVWPSEQRAGAVARAVRRLLARSGYRRRAARVARELEGWDGARDAAALAIELASRPRADRTGEPVTGRP